jgi:hypothetical protein
MNVLQSLARVYDGQASMAGVQREDTDAVLLFLLYNKMKKRKNLLMNILILF